MCNFYLNAGLHFIFPPPVEDAFPYRSLGKIRARWRDPEKSEWNFGLIILIRLRRIRRFALTRPIKSPNRLDKHITITIHVIARASIFTAKFTIARDVELLRSGHLPPPGGGDFLYDLPSEFPATRSLRTVVNNRPELATPAK